MTQGHDHHHHEPFDPATVLSPETLRDLPDTEEELPTQGEQVWGPSEEGNEPDHAGEFGPMAVEAAEGLREPEEQADRPPAP